MASWQRLLLRTILETETDDSSPVNEELMSQFRENWEALLLILLSTGVSGAADSDPPNDTTGVLTDASPGFSVDEHNGRTLLIRSGLAAGNFYTIDDTTTTTVICTGDNLYADGVRAGDTYIIFYDLKNNADGHNHDNVNSPYAVYVNGTVMLPYAWLYDDMTGYLQSTLAAADTWYDIYDINSGFGQGVPVYIPANARKLRISIFVGEANGTGTFRFRIGGSASNEFATTEPGPVGANLDYDCSGITEGWYYLTLQAKHSVGGAGGIIRIYWYSTAWFNV